MERSVEIFAAILLGVAGLSHLVQPRAWVDFFILLRNKGEAGAFADGFLNLLPAAIILAFHNVWSGIPMVLTLLGWCLLIKSLIRFCAPRYAVKLMGRVAIERAHEFQLAGVGLLVLAAVVGYAACAR